MSTWREQLRERTDSAALRDVLTETYHYPVLLALVGFALYTRVVNWQRFVLGEDVFFSGNDPYYHFRSTQYVVENWPATMPFEVWTNFPEGTSSAQFGTLFDQLIATAALLLGLGNPSDQLVELVFLFAPAIFGVATIIPAYFIGKRLGGRFGGVIAAAIVALAPGSLLTSGWVGTVDHHVAEALFQALAVLGTMVALTVAEREKPVYELVTDRAFGSIRATLGWSLLAGAAIGAYLLVWPPGVLLLGILGAFFLIHLGVEYVRGRSPEHAGFAGAVALTTAGIIALSTTNTLDVSATSRSILQPGLAFAVAFGCGFMAWLAREWDSRDLPRVGYPLAAVGLVVALALATAVVLPNLFGYFVDQVLRVIGFTTSPTAGTIGEAQPLTDPGQLVDMYGLAIAGAAGGAILLLAKQFRVRDARGEHLLVVVWMAFILAATFTQVRFMYYLTIPVAVLNAALAGDVVRFVAGTTDGDGIEIYQVMTVLAVIGLVLAPIAFVQPTALDRSTQKAPGEVIGWDSSLDWLDENTPAQGQYANPDGEPMEYMGTYEKTDDFDYPEGAYGTLAWWDYGHWITTTGERIPNANPFQQGTEQAANFLLAGNESAALDTLAERDEDDAETRYVMIDWKMADMTNKGSAPIAFDDDVGHEDLYSFLVDRNRLQSTGSFNQAVLGVRHKQGYYDSMVNRLYNYHGSAMSPQPYVTEWQGSEQELSSGATFTFAPGGNGTQGRVVRQFDSMQAARDYVAEAPEVRQLGGVGIYPNERVPALEHFRLVHIADGVTATQGGYQRTLASTMTTTPGWTKTFERVPGATIEGTGPPNTNVTARVGIQANVGNESTYTQQVTTDDSGSFSMTVPYATTGYDEWGLDEGYTETSVRATGPYTLLTPPDINGSTVSRDIGRVNVTEGQVLGEDDSPATVTLTEETQNISLGGNESSGDSVDVSDGGSGDGTDGGSSDGADTGTGDSGGGDQGSLAPPSAPAATIAADAEP